MWMTTILVSIIAAVLWALDTWATLVVIRNDQVDPRQKKFQYAFTWIVPVLGAGIVLAVLNDPSRPRKRSDDRGPPWSDGFDGGH